MPRRSADYWKNALVYGLVAWLYAVALSALLSNLAEVEFAVVSQSILMLLLITFWIVVLSFPRVIFHLVFAGLIVFSLRLWYDPGAWQKLIESAVFIETETTIRALLYFVGVRRFLMPEMAYFLQLFAIMASFIGAIVLWRLGWYLIAFIILAAPLFFQLQLPQTDWLGWLMLGLFAILMVASRQRYRYRGERIFQRPLIGPIAIVLVLTLGLGQLLPGDWFYSDDLSQWVNELDEPIRRLLDRDGRGLFTSGGGYDKQSSPIDGLINRLNEPYLTVYGPPHSFYLRGSVFTDFSGRTWYADEAEGWRDMPIGYDEATLDVFDPYRTLIWPDANSTLLPEADGVTVVPLPSIENQAVQVPRIIPEGLRGMPEFSPRWYQHFPIHEVLVEPLYLPMVSVYGPNAYRAIEPGQIETGFASVSFRPDGVAPAHYRYHPSGALRRHDGASDKAYRLEGYFVPVANDAAERFMLDIGLQPVATDAKGLPVTDRPLGERRYESVVAERDPELYRILYGDGLELEKVIAAKHYLAGNYTYDLAVTHVPRNREFVDWFLENKVGYCVHYGSVLALLLEDVGIASRYVEGFVSGEVAGDDSQVYRRTVTTDQAHAWTEVYLSGLGWYPFDATPAGEIDQLNDVAAEPLIPQDEYQVEDDIPPERELEDIEAPPRPEPLDEGGPIEAPDDEPIETSPLDIPWRWVMVGIGGLYFVWRHWVWKTRHHLGWIRWRYRGREDIMVKRIFRDIQELHRLGGYSLPSTWGSKQRFDDVLENSPALDYDNAGYAEQAIEEVYYAERIPTERQLAGLFSYHEKLELRVRNKLSWYEWWLRRYVWSSRHPL